MVDVLVDIPDFVSGDHSRKTCIAAQTAQSIKKK